MVLSTFVGVVCAKKSLLLLLLGLVTPNKDDDKLDEFINDDGFKTNPEKDPNKSYLITELNKVKTKFRTDLDEKGTLKDIFGNTLSPRGIYQLIIGHQIRIRKLRLIIEQDILITKNEQKPSGIVYLIARKYWVGNDGKKLKKFSKNIGSQSKVLVRGKIPTSYLIQVEKELEKKMWEQYRIEYPE
jgi:hypothetical protein